VVEYGNCLVVNKLPASLAIPARRYLLVLDLDDKNVHSLVKWVRDSINGAKTHGEGFLLDALAGYAIKKVMKIASVVIGLFVVGLAYLSYTGWVDVKWVAMVKMLQG
jgi:FUN14 family